MSLQWYMPKRLELEDLEHMGVTLKDARGKAVAFVDEDTSKVLCEVGDVAVYPDGRVSIWPRRSINLVRSLPAMLTCAEDALMGKHHHRDGWHRKRTSKSSFWRCTVLVVLPETDDLAISLRRGRAACVEDNLDCEMRIVEDLQ